MSNQVEKITWSAGKLTGFYIDFTHQEIGFKETSEHLEFRKIFLLEYMYDNRDEYINLIQTEQIDELNSINLPKYISNIKAKIVKVLASYYSKEECEELFNEVIEKKKTNGIMGYRLLTDNVLEGELVSEESDTEEKPAEKSLIEDNINKEIITDESSVEENTYEKIDADSEKEPETFKTYLQNNWLVLFLFFYGTIMGVFFGLYEKLSVGELFVKIMNTPLYIVLAIFVTISLLPILSGVLIDTPIARLKNGETPYFSPNSRFDARPIHIFFFGMCNLTGALTVVSMMYYVSKVAGFEDYLLNGKHKIPFIIIILGSVLVALYNNFCLQMRESPARNRLNFRLTRLHTIFNTIHLTIAISVGCCIMYALMTFRFTSGFNSDNGLDSAFIIMMMSFYSYLWFSSDSPMAEKLDSISNANFLAGIPVLVVMSVMYIIYVFDGSMNCYMAILMTLIALILWITYLLQRKKDHTLNFIKIMTSFFSVIAGISILMIIISSISL